MIRVTEDRMDEGTYFIRVQKTGEDDRVFFDGDENCIWNYLLELGLGDSEINTYLNSIKNVKL